MLPAAELFLSIVLLHDSAEPLFKHNLTTCSAVTTLSPTISRCRMLRSTCQCPLPWCTGCHRLLVIQVYPFFLGAGGGGGRAGAVSAHRRESWQDGCEEASGRAAERAHVSQHHAVHGHHARHPCILGGMRGSCKGFHVANIMQCMATILTPSCSGGTRGACKGLSLPCDRRLVAIQMSCMRHSMRSCCIMFGPQIACGSHTQCCQILEKGISE